MASICSLPPDTPFLPGLVEAILEGDLLPDWPKTGPYWLSDATIILPTRRARQKLPDLFARALGGHALLPDIRVLGPDSEADMLAPGALPEDQHKKPVSFVDRRFILCRLVQGWVAQQDKQSGRKDQSMFSGPARVLGLADSLASLIDDMEIEGVSAGAIRSLADVKNLKGPDLAENFLHNLDFLEIALSLWPKILEDENRMDSARLRNLAMDRTIAGLSERFGDRPVILAGSTGSVPATARLIKAVSRLPRGRIVLPGLDTGLSEHSFSRLLDAGNAPHGHPQYGLCRLLRYLGTSPGQVREIGVTSPRSTRTGLVRASLALPEETEKWSKVRSTVSEADMEKALETVSIAHTASEQEQALVVALAARRALADGQSVGVITPDRDFARRIMAQLKRFGIAVDDSAGQPLYQSGAGRLIRQIMNAACSRFAPVDLMALLNNPAVKSLEDGAGLIELLDLSLLRGQSPARGLNGLKQSLERNLSGQMEFAVRKLSAEQGAAISRLLKGLETAFAPLNDLLTEAPFSAADLADCLIRVLETLTGKDPFAVQGWSEAVQWKNELVEAARTGPLLNASNAISTLATLMSHITVRAQVAVRSDIYLWGRLEARLQSADLLIMATLNETVWPEIADPGPWLSRNMRLHAGLEPPERHHGLAAHDFQMAMGNHHVLLTYAARLGTSPALPSRLLERFLAFVGAPWSEKMMARGQELVQMARQLDAVETVTPALRPTPSPPVALRPKNLSVTEVESLIRSPFDLYAKHVLKLRPVEPLGADMDARARGNLVHAALARFVKEGHDALSPRAQKEMEHIARQEFAALDHQPEKQQIWLYRFLESARGFLAFEAERDGRVDRRFAEQDLTWQAPPGALPFALHGRADRIDRLSDGSFEILDFKTGSIPEKNDMKELLAPQLLVEAAMVRDHGFAEVPPGEVSSLAYVKISANPAAFALKPFAMPVGLDITAALERMMMQVQARAEAFLFSDHLPMYPRIIPNVSRHYPGPYDHLARTDEWTTLETGGDE